MWRYRGCEEGSRRSISRRIGAGRRGPRPRPVGDTVVGQHEHAAVWPIHPASGSLWGTYSSIKPSSTVVGGLLSVRVGEINFVLCLVGTSSLCGGLWPLSSSKQIIWSGRASVDIVQHRHNNKTSPGWEYLLSTPDCFPHSTVLLIWRLKSQIVQVTDNGCSYLSLRPRGIWNLAFTTLQCEPFRLTSWNYFII